MKLLQCQSAREEKTTYFLTSRAGASNPREGEVTEGITPEGRSPDIGWEKEVFGSERGEEVEEDWPEGEEDPSGVLGEEKAGSMLLCASR